MLILSIFFFFFFLVKFEAVGWGRAHDIFSSIEIKFFKKYCPDRVLRSWLEASQFFILSPHSQPLQLLGSPPCIYPYHSRARGIQLRLNKDSCFSLGIQEVIKINESTGNLQNLANITHLQYTSHLLQLYFAFTLSWSAIHWQPFLVWSYK